MGLRMRGPPGAHLCHVAGNTGNTSGAVKGDTELQKLRGEKKDGCTDTRAHVHGARQKSGNVREEPGWTC